MIDVLELAIDPLGPDDTVVPLLRAGADESLAPPDERDIAAALVAGHTVALEAAFRRWSDLVHGVARQMVGHDDADDVTQQVFVEAWRTREGFDPDRGEVPGWLVGITRNVARQHLRRRPAAAQLQVVGDLDGDDAAEDAADVVDALVVAAALRDLPDEQRAVLELALLHDHTQSEVAAELGIPLGTVKSRHRRGLQALRRALGGAR